MKDPHYLYIGNTSRPGAGDETLCTERHIFISLLLESQDAAEQCQGPVRSVLLNSVRVRHSDSKNGIELIKKSSKILGFDMYYTRFGVIEFMFF